MRQYQTVIEGGVWWIREIRDTEPHGIRIESRWHVARVNSLVHDLAVM